MTHSRFFSATYLDSVYDDKLLAKFFPWNLIVLSSIWVYFLILKLANANIGNVRLKFIILDFLTVNKDLQSIYILNICMCKWDECKELKLLEATTLNYGSSNASSTSSYPCKFEKKNYFQNDSKK